MLMLLADLPAAAERPIQQDQVQSDVALGLGCRVLLHDAEVNRGKIWIPGTPYLIQRLPLAAGFLPFQNSA
jgi:hypothetical protein